jgi:ADP-ribosylglycohydrolase
VGTDLRADKRTTEDLYFYPADSEGGEVRDSGNIQATAYRSRVRGCLLGGAIGDALGAPIEFETLSRLRDLYGPAGLSDLDVYAGRRGAITDDTQMSLFTAEGLIQAAETGREPAVEVYEAHLRWLDTQRLTGPAGGARGLAAQQWLYARRAPGNACLSGLAAGRMGTLEAPANPNSKGCGTVMRSAPFGLDPHSTPEDAFELAVRCAVQTHGHPSGYLAAGAVAAIVHLLIGGVALGDAVAGTLDLLASRDNHEEVTAALNAVVTAMTDKPGPGVVERLGGGWVAEEALAIAVYCALAHPAAEDVRTALLLAVNHSGDSDSTGAICGNLLGAWHGESALPPDWASEIEGRDMILRSADALAAVHLDVGR